MKSYRRIILCALLCASLLLTCACSKDDGGKTPGGSDSVQSDSADTEKQNDTDTKEASDTEAPETAAPDTEASDTEAPADDHVPTETENKPAAGDDAENTDPVDVPAETEPADDSGAPGGVLTDIAGMTDSGRFVSGEAKNLKLLVDWEYVILSDGTAQVTVNIGISHYRLYANEKVNWGAVQVDGNAVLFTTPEITCEENTLTYTPFFSAVYTTDRGSMELEASWRVLGTYAGEEIDTLTAGGTITFGASEASSDVR